MVLHELLDILDSCRQIAGDMDSTVGWHVPELNDELRSRANYPRSGPVGKAYRAIDAYTTKLLRRWL